MTLSAACVDKLVAHYWLLTKWNRAVRLVGDTDPQVVVRRHIMESLALIPFIHEPSGSLLDIGSGNGYPAIPLKAAMDQLRLAMLEPTVRKGAFLNAAISEAHLTDASVIRGRVDRPKDLARWGRWDCISMRAVAAIGPVLDGAAQALRPSGRVLLMLGAAGREQAISRMSGPLRLIVDSRLPETRASWIVVAELADVTKETIH